MNTKKRNKIFGLILIPAGIVMSLLIGEFVCRTYTMFKNSTSYKQASSNANLRVEPKPSIEYVNRFGIRRKLNSTGVEGPELSNINHRIFKTIFLGYSIIEKGYLPKKKRLPELLKKKISKHINRKVVG